MTIRIRHYPFKKLTYKMAGSRRIDNRGNCKKRKQHAMKFMNRTLRLYPEKYYWLKKLDARFNPFR